MSGADVIASLLVPAAVRRAVAAHAVAAWPEECCGLLTGSRDGDLVRVTRAVPSLNLATDRRRRFEIDPQLWFDLRRTLAGGEAAIVGCYHSHPDGSAAPSPRDLADAWHPGFVWLVVAVADGRVRDTTAWLFEDDAAGRRFRPLAFGGAGGSDTGHEPRGA